MSLWGKVQVSSCQCLSSSGPILRKKLGEKAPVSVNTTGALIPEAWHRNLPKEDSSYEFIISGVEQGFRLVSEEFTGESVFMKNYNSATGKPRDAVEAQIKEELVNGRYKKCTHTPTVVSALGAIPKPDSKAVRIIHDCSRPHGGALNDFAVAGGFAFQSIQDAVDITPPGAFLAKVDLKSAYRSVPVHPMDLELTGLSWTFKGDNEPTLMRDHRLPFGARLSPEIFNELSQAIRRMMHRRGFPGVVCYLDDFLCVGTSWEECNSTLMTLMDLLRELGFAINYNKVVDPARRLVFLGVEMDAEERVLRLPTDKLTALQREIRAALSCRSLTKKALQSLAGRLNWATRVIYGGRFHLRRVLDRIQCLKAPWHRTRVTDGVKADLLWWMEFLPSFNGRTPMVDCRPTTPVCLDACLTAGGGYFDGEWFHLRCEDWPGVQPLHINYKEVLVLEPAARLRAPYWRDKKVIIYSDSTTAVSIINKGSTRDPFVMSALRRIFHLSVKYNFQLTAIHYPGVYNGVADAASRLHERGGWVRLQNLLINTHIW